MTEDNETTEVNPNSSQNISVENIPQERIRQLSQELGSFFDAPAAAVQQASETKAEIVNAHVLATVIEKHLQATGEMRVIKPMPINEGFRAVALALGKNAEEIQRNNIEAEEAIRDEFSQFGGVFIPGTPENNAIYVNESARTSVDEIVPHELLHVMAANEKGTGFHANDGSGRDINEGVTQFLNLCKLNPNLSPAEIAIAIRNGKIKTVYSAQTLKIATVIGATGQGSKPITVKELAGDYFRKDDPSVKRTMFQWKVIQRAPPIHQAAVTNIMSKFV